MVFTTWFDGEVGLGWVPADGSGPVEELIKGVGMRSFERTHPVMLPDGSGVIMTGLAPGATVEDLLFVPLTGERRLEPLFQAPGVERNPAIAPSGRFIAYNSDESGTSRGVRAPVPECRLPKVADLYRRRRRPGVDPRWERDCLPGQPRPMVAVAVLNDRDGEFDYSKPEALFKVGRGGDRGLDRGWDVTADGERFLFTCATASRKERRRPRN